MNERQTQRPRRPDGAALQIHPAGMELRAVRVARAHLRQADPVLQPGAMAELQRVFADITANQG